MAWEEGSFTATPLTLLTREQICLASPCVTYRFFTRHMKHTHGSGSRTRHVRLSDGCLPRQVAERTNWRTNWRTNVTPIGDNGGYAVPNTKYWVAEESDKRTPKSNAVPAKVPSCGLLFSEPVEGFEPPASCLQNNRSTPELHRRTTQGYLKLTLRPRLGLWLR